MILYCLLFIDIYDTEAYYSVPFLWRFFVHCSTVLHYLSLPLRYYVAEGVRLYSQNLEGGHTDQGTAAGTRAAHPQSSEWGDGIFACSEIFGH